MDATTGAKLARCQVTMLFRWRVRRVARSRIATTTRRRRPTLPIVVGRAAERALALSGLPDRFRMKPSSEVAAADKSGGGIDTDLGAHSDETRHRLRGWAVIIGGVSAMVSPTLGVVVMVIGWNMQRVLDAGRRQGVGGVRR